MLPSTVVIICSAIHFSAVGRRTVAFILRPRQWGTELYLCLRPTNPKAFLCLPKLGSAQ